MQGVDIMKKIIYHGSEKKIEHPQFGYGKSYNDYGVGFYCTEELDMAKEWAASADRSGFANGYEIDLENLNILDLNDEKYCNLHWLALLLNNRTFDCQSSIAIEAKDYILKNFLINRKEYDVIKGYRADDSYFSFAQDFINGSISYRQLCNAMMLGELGQQIVLISEEAFQQLEFRSVDIVDGKEWYEKKYNRDKKARDDFFNLERNRRKKGDVYVYQIIDEEMNADDQRLR